MKLVELAFFTDDVAALTAFYEHLLGALPDESGPGISIFRSDGLQVLIHERYAPAEGDPPCEDHVAFQTEDLDAAYARLVEAGLAVIAPPTVYDWGRSAYLRDPDGRLLELQGSRAR